MPISRDFAAYQNAGYHPGSHDLYLMLFTNDITPTVDTLLAALTEAVTTDTGYARITLTAANWAFVKGSTGGDTPRWTYNSGTACRFTFNGSFPGNISTGGTVYGWAVLWNDSGTYKLLFSKRLSGDGFAVGDSGEDYLDVTVFLAEA